MTVLEEASAVINGPRRESYGSAKASFQRIASVWSAVLGHTVTPEQVALCMIGLKLVRESNKHHRDNIVDVIGYAALLEQIGEQ